ncbi:hypothetical protein [Gephyromycinifex aptenodytis]|uniref:hypothetical protein n=1 Tax=Gephyromycinifex aptenodytis TaxID=2716227 RepID=UPI001444DE13|nr:hypothetical protein [Gephyromycinifex aptenodytis]
MREPIDAETMHEAREVAADLIELPHPFEAAATREVNEADEVSALASRIVHESPRGFNPSEPSRPVWVVEHFAPGEEGQRLSLTGWCWFATEPAAMSAARNCDDTTVVHQIPVPRSVRSSEVEAHLANHYRQAPRPVE